MSVKPWAWEMDGAPSTESQTLPVCGSKEVIIKPHPQRRLGGINQHAVSAVSLLDENSTIIEWSWMATVGTLLISSNKLNIIHKSFVGGIGVHVRLSSNSFRFSLTSYIDICQRHIKNLLSADCWCDNNSISYCYSCLIYTCSCLNSGKVIMKKAHKGQIPPRPLELIMAGLENISDPTWRAVVRFRSVPEAGLCSALLRIRGFSIFDGRHEQPASIWTEQLELARNQTQKQYREYGRFTK